MKRQLLFATLFLSVGIALAGHPPYDEDADARSDLQQTLAAAQASHQPVLVLFGANWCENCRALNNAMRTGRNAELITHEFKVVRIAIGNFDHNLDLVSAYGNPIAKGIPAVVVLSPDNTVLYATRAGELAHAVHMSPEGIHDFFRHAVDAAQFKP